jgi:diguanylate cyclase (GGDEF)-like protein/PAS domain S-box-containing protein
MHEESLAVTSSVFAAMSEGVAILDGDFRVLEINQGLTDLTGYTISDVRGRSFREFGTGNTSNATYDAIERSLTNFGSWRGQVTNIHAGGRLSQDLLNISTSTDSSGDIRRIIVVLTPSERLLIDSVTQLANRPLFEDQLTRAFESLNTFEQKLVLVHVGVEGIGAVNDSFGHLAGDTVLRELASRLALFSVSPESIGRIADTEFALYRTGDDVVGNTDSWTQAILDSISEPFHFEDVQILLKASAGISISPDDSLNAAEIRTHADQAYKASLAPNGSQISYFSQQMENRAKVRSYLTSDLRDALRREELQFYFQPIIRLSDGAVVKAEALSRWIDPQLGEISPSRFIPLAETSNLIHELGSQLFSACISMIAELEAIGNPLQISINLSPAEIMSPAFARETELRAAIAQGVDPGRMTFELTEGVLLERPDVVMARISSMRALGVQFAIDDFGTGYSSLSYLQRLSVDYVKIDKTFVDDIETEEGLSLCRSIIDLAHALKLQVIAEGVESHAQMVILTNLGCDLAQGYLFSKPLPRDSFINFLSTARALTL